MLSYEQIKDLIESVDSSSLRVFEFESQGTRLRLSKNDEAIKEVQSLSVETNEAKGNIYDSSINANLVSNNQLNNINESNIEKVEIKENLNIVKSPLVGTYYSSVSQGGKPYVEKGDKVKKGDVLCIVEAMKIMNEIVSEFDGEVVEVLRNDEDIVEFGMELFKIK